MAWTCKEWFQWFGTALLGAVVAAGCLGRDDQVLQPETTRNNSETQPEPTPSALPSMGPSPGPANDNPNPQANGQPTNGQPASEPVMDGNAGRDAADGGANDTMGSSAASEPDGSGDGDSALSDAGATEPAPQGAQDPDCDLTGIWIAQQITVSQALQLPQSSNNYYYLELSQTGARFEVVDHFDCGVEVRGSAVVSLARPALQAQLEHNRQVGRAGTMHKQGDTCAFEAERFWSVRGADEQRFLPGGGRRATDSIQAVAMANPLPTRAMPDGAIDPDGDGKLGLSFEVSGLIAGTRNSVQRDWSRWFTEPGYQISPSMDWPDDLIVRADFDNEEHVLDPASGLLTSLSSPSANAKHELRLRFLGRDASDPRVSPIVKADPVDTCYAIQDAMPPETLQ